MAAALIEFDPQRGRPRSSRPTRIEPEEGSCVFDMSNHLIVESGSDWK
jgi:hypothetical protein